MKVLLIVLLLALPLGTQAGQVLFEGNATSNYPLEMVLNPGTLTCPNGYYVSGPIPMSTTCSEGSKIHMDNVLLQTYFQLQADFNPDAPNANLWFDSVGTVKLDLLSARWNEDSEGSYKGEVRPFVFTNLVDQFVLAGTFNAKRTMMADHWLSETTYKLTGFRTSDRLPVKFVMHMDYVLFSAIPMPYELYWAIFGDPPYYGGNPPLFWQINPEGTGSFVMSVDDEG